MPAFLRRIDSAIVIAAALALLLPLGVLGPRMINVAASITAILVALRLAADNGARPAAILAALRRPAVAVAALLIAWGCASTMWSVNPRQSLDISLSLAAIFGGGFVLLAAVARLGEPDRTRLASFFLAGGVAVLVLLAIDMLADGMLRAVVSGHGFTTFPTLTHLNRFSSMAALLGWVTVAIVWRRHGAAWACVPAAASVTVMYVLEPSTPGAAWLAGALVFALAWFRIRAAVWLLAGIVVVRAVLVPWFDAIAPSIESIVIAQGLQYPLQSLGHRLEIWSFAAEMLRDRPLTGWGLDASRSIPGGRELVKIYGTIINRYSEAMPLHPHSMVTELWLELGVPGILLGLAFVVRALAAVPVAFPGRPARAAAMAMAATAIVLAESSYGIWQDWWLCTLWLGSVALFAACGARRPEGMAS